MQSSSVRSRARSRAHDLVALPPSARAALLLASLALPACASTSAQTSRDLDGAYDLATQRLAAGPSRAGEATDPPTYPALDPATYPALDRDALIALAVARSPALAAMAHRARALIHAGRAERALPSPEVGVQLTNLPLTRPYALGEASMYMVELQQRFPVAAALDARARAMSEEARAALAELTTEERMTAQRAADAFASYVQGEQERAVEAQQLVLLERMAAAIRARYSTGGAALADAPRLELELAKTRRAIARSEGDVAQARAALNALLRRASTAPLAVPPESPPETVRLSEDELLRRADANRGTTLAADARLRGARARQAAADAEARVPEFMVGLGYYQDPQMRPGFGATFSMSLPWLWGAQVERSAQAREEIAAELSTRDAADVDAHSEISAARARLASSENQLAVVNTQALPAARRAIDALSAGYVTGGVTLLEWVDAAREVLEFELERVALSAELAHSLAELERAVGAPLPRVLLTDEERP